MTVLAILLYAVIITLSAYSRVGGREAQVTYERPEITDLGSIADHTFETRGEDFKGAVNLDGDYGCELSHSGPSPVGHCLE
ncbi:MAG TPA: hypothetical protein VIL12_02000 [Acidimicrobiia bacterium]